jgi:hypothetical protein
MESVQCLVGGHIPQLYELIVTSSGHEVCRVVETSRAHPVAMTHQGTVEFPVRKCPDLAK